MTPREEIEQAKIDAEKAIQEALGQFWRRTGFYITAVDLNLFSRTNDQRYERFYCEVKVRIQV